MSSSSLTAVCDTDFCLNSCHRVGSPFVFAFFLKVNPSNSSKKLWFNELLFPALMHENLKLKKEVQKFFNFCVSLCSDKCWSLSSEPQSRWRLKGIHTRQKNSQQVWGCWSDLSSFQCLLVCWTTTTKKGWTCSLDSEWRACQHLYQDVNPWSSQDFLFQGEVLFQSFRLQGWVRTNAGSEVFLKCKRTLFRSENRTCNLRSDWTGRKKDRKEPHWCFHYLQISHSLHPYHFKRRGYSIVLLHNQLIACSDSVYS